MGRKLNKLSDEMCKKLLENDLGVLEKILARGPRSDAPADLEKYLHAAGDTSCDVGLTMYQEDSKPRDIQAHLKKAAELLLREHTVRTPPEQTTNRNPWSFAKTVDLVLCFGDADQRRALASVEPWQYRYPPHPGQDGLAMYLELVKRFAGDGRLDVEACRAAEARFASDAAPKEERQILLPGTRGLRAAVEHDAAAWNEAVTELCDTHEEEAKRGELKRSVQAFICLPALALAKLGGERGLTIDVRSEYLPLVLLEPLS